MLYEDVLEMYKPKFIIGLDEVGAGSICGPVVIGCCVYEVGFGHNSVKDSKRFSSKRARTKAHEIVQITSLYCRAYEASSLEIFEEGQGPCLQRLFKQAVLDALNIFPDDSVIIIDGKNRIKDITHPQEAVIKADNIVPAVSGASIIAKVYRDTLMEHLAKDFPEYSWHTNSGYGTTEHWDAIKNFGIVPEIHRLSIATVNEAFQLYGNYNVKKKASD